MNPHDVFITGMARTPMGAFQGELSTLAAPQLGATAIRAAPAATKAKWSKASITTRRAVERGAVSVERQA